MMTTNDKTSWPASWEPLPTPTSNPPDAGPVPQTPAFPPPLGGPGHLAHWLDEQAHDFVHPKLVEEQLLRSGWHPTQATMEAFRYRRRFNEHPLGYTALLVATGVAALAAGTVGHLLARGIDNHIDTNVLAVWLTIGVVALPFAIWAHIWAVSVDRDDPVAVWSAPRRSLAQALVWACGIVGIGRLIIYVAQLMGSLVGATWAQGSSALEGGVNVAITVTLALPLGLWAFRFLHRFDDEDPARPRSGPRTSGRRGSAA